MDLQSVFYVVSIIFILGWFIFLIMLMVMAWVVFNKTKKIQDVVTERLDSPTSKIMMSMLPVVMVVGPLMSRIFRRNKNN